MRMRERERERERKRKYDALAGKRGRAAARSELLKCLYGLA